ncbi:hypothetical protein ACFQH2_16350 [Natronoarchaeum sp. GCM10025703]|uniref:hypothetical protein n=1 Tax=Natronoarchaeum sp. GCM10025703 TaxID=3252685 RepID=UPI003608916D
MRAEDTLSVQELAERIAEAERVDIAKQGKRSFDCITFTSRNYARTTSSRSIPNRIAD